MKRLQRLLAFVLSFALLHATMIQTAQAGMISTEEVARSTAVDLAGSGHARLAAGLARADVQSELERQGIDPALVVQRVAALTDDEASRLADQIDSAPAGSGIGALVGAAVFVFLVLVFTDIMGWTKVFPFTRSMR
jgi:hypothetical protein